MLYRLSYVGTCRHERETGIEVRYSIYESNEELLAKVFSAHVMGGCNLAADAGRGVLRPVAGRERARTAYDLYVKASALDEDPATLDEAEALYKQAIALDPWLAIAHTNLGNIRFRRGDEDAAITLYHEALKIERTQPEAQYNLGYVLLERGHADEAVGYFKGAIAGDPRFADAYFNLAMAYEQLGDAENARPCWRHYLEIEPTGTWAEIAKKHL